MGEVHSKKAWVFWREHNHVQSLRFSESALTSLKKLHPRSLEIITRIDDMMATKYNALNFMDRNKEALECAKERYSLWAAGNMRHYGMLKASTSLIESLIQNKEYEQAELIARTAYEMITSRYDNIIPECHRQHFLAVGSRLLSDATYRLAESGGIASEEKQKAGEKAIALARKALEIHTQLHGSESAQAASDMVSLAKALKYFNDVDDDGILHLYEQAKSNYSLKEGNLSPNVAVCEHSLAAAYIDRAGRARDTNDFDRCVANLELALTHYREAERIYRINNYMDAAGRVAQRKDEIEEELIEVRIAQL